MNDEDFKSDESTACPWPTGQPVVKTVITSGDFPQADTHAVTARGGLVHDLLSTFCQISTIFQSSNLKHCTGAEE